MTAATQFQYKNEVLHAEDTSLLHLAKKFGTPLYVYSLQALKDAWKSYEEGMQGRDVLICYGMKANSNLAILNQFHKMGAGFDIVSGGELARVIAAGGEPSKVVFSGVGKQSWEIRDALEAGVKCFNVESEGELERISRIAYELGKTAPVSLRVNPDVDAKTHPYISTGLKENKFGIDIQHAKDVYLKALKLPNLKITGIDCHIGSQITELAPYKDALKKLIKLIKKLEGLGIKMQHIDLGGGLGIRYTNEQTLAPAQLLDMIFTTLDANNLGHLQLVLEPGRSLVGNAGVLLTRVEYIKSNEAKNFAVVDAAMNDLLRPTLYDAWHGIQTVIKHPESSKQETYDVVGPICESGDWLAKDRSLHIKPGDLLAVMSAGAYAFSMASQYNSRPRAAEVMVRGNKADVIRKRENIQGLFINEQTLD